MTEEKIRKVIEAAEQAEKVPNRLGWKITAVLYGHGKVVVQVITTSGKPTQFVAKV